MKIHEYQGKQIFARYGIRVPKGYPCFDVASAEAVIVFYGGEPVEII